MKEIVIKLSNLTLNINKTKILDSLNFEIYKGELVGYIGTNGAGKSSTIKVLLNLIQMYEGEVFIFGNNIKGQQEYKKRIGYVPEIAAIYECLSIEEYLEFIGELYKVDKILIKKRINKFLRLFSIDKYYGQSISSLSKGTKQKVLIIASLIHNPDILILDEPLTGLDANSIILFKLLLKELTKRNKTVFYSSHMMDIVEKISDRIILIDNGKLLANDTFNNLQQKYKKTSLDGIFNELINIDELEKIVADSLSILEE